MIVKIHTDRKESNTGKRFSEGEVKLFILEQMLKENDKWDWQTKNFLSALNASFEPKRVWKRDSVINHLRQLRKSRFVEFDKVKNQYSLPKNFDSFDYTKALSEEFDSVLVAGLLRHFSKDTQEKYLLYHFDQTAKNIDKELSTKPRWKQLEILARRESDLAMNGMESIIRDSTIIAFMKGLKLTEKDVKWQTLLEKQREKLDTTLELTLGHLGNIEKLGKNKDIPKASRFILIYVFNHVIRRLKQENLIDY